MTDNPTGTEEGRDTELLEPNYPVSVSINVADPLDERGLVLVDERGEHLSLLPEMHIMLARNAERSGITSVAGYCAELIDVLAQKDHIRYQERRALEWLQSALTNVADGASPDEAFLWKLKGHKGPRPTVSQSLQIAKIQLDVDLRKKDAPDKSIDDILYELAQEEGVSHETMWARYKRSKRDIKPIED